MGIIICRSPYISFGAYTCNSSQLDHPVPTIICCHGFPGKSLCCLSSGPTDCQPPVASGATMRLHTLWQWPHAECIQSIKTALCAYACKNACLGAYAMLTPLQLCLLKHLKLKVCLFLRNSCNCRGRLYSNAKADEVDISNASITITVLIPHQAV